MENSVYGILSYRSSNKNIPTIQSPEKHLDLTIQKKWVINRLKFSLSVDIVKGMRRDSNELKLNLNLWPKLEENPKVKIDHWKSAYGDGDEVGDFIDSVNLVEKRSRKLKKSKKVSFKAASSLIDSIFEIV